MSAAADTLDAGLAEMAARVRSGEVRAADLVEEALERIDARAADHNCLRRVFADEARAQAAGIDAQVDAGEDPGPLAGVPMAIKDNIDIAGFPIEAASLLLAGRVAEEDAEVIRRLRAAGAVFVATAHMSEFAIGGTTQNDHHGPAFNAWDTERTTGGSSGGSGAVVGAGILPAALGTDTGGSVRLPAAFNGITGLRQSFGRVSNRGSIPVGASFDTIGPMAHSAADVALLLSVMAGPDDGDPWCSPLPPGDYLGGLEGGVEGVRVGIPRAWLAANVEPDVLAAVEEAGSVLAGLGAEVVEVALPEAGEVRDLGAVLMMTEAAWFHRERLATAPEGFGEAVRARLAWGEAATGPEHAGRLEARAAFTRAVDRVMEDVDVLLCATTPYPAPRLDGLSALGTAREINVMTLPWVLSGQPALAMPCGMVDGMPVSAQLVGRRFADAEVLAIAHAYQQATGWHELRPAAATAAGDAA